MFYHLILQAKLQQCPEFRQCLIESTGMVIAEATQSKIWATGMTPYVTERTSQTYWPGRNLLGAMLMEMSQELSRQESQSMECANESDELTGHGHFHTDGTGTPLLASVSQPDTQPDIPSNQLAYLATQASQTSTVKQANQSNSQETGQPTIDSVCIQSNQQTEESMLIQQSGQPTTSGQPTLPATSGASSLPDTSRAEIPFSSSPMNALGGASGGESSHSSRSRRKSPAYNRTSRSFSAHSRRHSTPRHKTDGTPSIKSALEKKRKEPASSPDQPVTVQEKVQKSEDGVS